MTQVQALRPARVATGIVIAYSLLITWFSLQSYLQSDDFSIQTRAYLAPWGSPDLLFQPWGGHVMPGAFALAQVLAKTMPFTYLPMALLIAGGLAAAAWFARALLRDILGDTWAMVVALVAYLACAGTWQAATWWTAALNAVPMLIVLPLALRWHLQWLRGGPASRTWLAFAAIAAGLVFFEKVALLVPVLAWLTVALGPPGAPDRQRLHRRILRSLRAAPLLWLSYALLLGVFGALYIATRTSSLAEPIDLSTYAQMLALGVFGTYAPTVLGGPWTWSPLGLATTPGILVIVAAQALLAIALVQSLRSQVARRLWAMVAVYVVAVATIVALGRQGFGIQVITQPRYFSDAAVLTIVVISLAAMAVRRRARVDAPREGDPSGDDHSDGRDVRARRGWHIAAVIATINVVLIGAGTTIAALSAQMLGQPARDYVVTSVDRLQSTSMPILDGIVPDRVLWGLASPDNEYSRFYAPIVGPDRFADSVSAAWAIDLRGEIVPGRVVGIDSRPGPTDWCGWPVVEGRGRVVFDLAAFPADLVVGLEYFTEAPSTLTLALGEGDPVDVPLEAGPNTVYTRLIGSGDTLEITSDSPGVGVCITSATMGILLAVQP